MHPDFVQFSDDFSVRFNYANLLIQLVYESEYAL